MMISLVFVEVIGLGRKNFNNFIKNLNIIILWIELLICFVIKVIFDKFIEELFCDYFCVFSFLDCSNVMGK